MRKVNYDSKIKELVRSIIAENEQKKKSEQEIDEEERKEEVIPGSVGVNDTETSLSVLDNTANINKSDIIKPATTTPKTADELISSINLNDKLTINDLLTFESNVANLPDADQNKYKSKFANIEIKIISNIKSKFANLNIKTISNVKSEFTDLEMKIISNIKSNYDLDQNGSATMEDLNKLWSDVKDLEDRQLLNGKKLSTVLTDLQTYITQQIKKENNIDYDFNKDGKTNLNDLLSGDLNNDGTVTNLEKAFLNANQTNIINEIVNEIKQNKTLTISDLLAFEDEISVLSEEDKKTWKSAINKIENQMIANIKTNFNLDEDENVTKDDLVELWNTTYNIGDKKLLNGTKLSTLISNLESSIAESAQKNDHNLTNETIKDLKDNTIENLKIQHTEGIYYSKLKDTLYNNGVVFNGPQDGILYEEGKPINGIHEGLMYQDGTLYDGDNTAETENSTIKTSYYLGKPETVSTTIYTDSTKTTIKEQENCKFNDNYRLSEKEILSYDDNGIANTVTQTNFVYEDNYSINPVSYTETNSDGTFNISDIKYEDGEVTSYKQTDNDATERLYILNETGDLTPANGTIGEDTYVDGVKQTPQVEPEKTLEELQQESKDAFLTANQNSGIDFANATFAYDNNNRVTSYTIDNVTKDILYDNDGELLNGTNSSDNKLYQHGILFNGTIGEDTYIDGVKQTPQDEPGVLVQKTITFTNPEQYYSNYSADITFISTSDISMEDIEYKWSGTTLYIYNLRDKNIILGNTNATIYLNCENCELTVDKSDSSYNLNLIGNDNNIKGSENLSIVGQNIHVTGLNNNVSGINYTNQISSSLYIVPEYTISGTETKTIPVTYNNQTVNYKVSSKDGSPVTFKIERDGNKTSIWGDNLKIDMDDERTSQYSYTYLYGNNNELNLNNAGYDTDIIMQGDNNILDVNNANSNTDVTINGDKNTVNTSENIPLSGVKVLAKGIDNNVGKIIRTSADGTTIYLIREYTISGTETKTIPVTYNNQTVNFEVSSKDGSPVTFKIERDGNKTYILGDNLKIDMDDERTSQYSYTYLYGNNSELNLNKSGYDTDIITVGDSNNINVNHSNSETNLTIKGDNNNINSSENIFIAGTKVNVTGQNNTIGDLKYETLDDRNIWLNATYTISSGESKTIPVTYNNQTVNYEVSSKDGSPVTFKINRDGNKTYIWGDNLKIDIDDERTSQYSYTYLYGNNSELNLNNAGYNTDIITVGDNNNININKKNSETDITIKGDNNKVSSIDTTELISMDVKLTGKNNKVGKSLYSLSDDTTAYLNPTYTISGTETVTIPITYNKETVNYTVSSKNGDAITFEIRQYSNYTYIYGDSLNIDVENNRTNQTSYTYLYGNNSNITINKAGKYNDIITVGDNNNVLLNDTTGSHDITFKGDNNNISSKDGLDYSKVKTTTSGENNNVFGVTKSATNNIINNDYTEYTISGTEPKTITWTDSNGKKFSFEVSSKDGSEKSFKAYRNSNTYYISGNDINISIVDDDTNSTSSSGSSNVYVYGNNSDVVIDKVAYNTDITIQGDNNNIVANAFNNYSDFVIKGDNNKIDKGVNLYGYDKTVKVTGLNNTVGGRNFSYSNDTTRELQQIYTVSGTEPRTITWTDSNGKKFTFKVTSKDGSEQSYKIYSSNGSYYLYGDNINVSIVDDATDSTSTYDSSSVYFYGTNSDINIDKVSYNTDITIQGDNNNIVANAFNNYSDFVIKGDNNKIDKGVNLYGYDKTVKVTGLNNTVADQLYKVSNDATRELQQVYTVSGTEPRTITWTDSNGKKFTFKVTSKDGSEQSYKIYSNSGSYYLYGDNINVSIVDDDTNSTSSYGSSDIYFYGTNSDISIDKVAYNTDVTIQGDNNNILANAFNNNSNFAIKGDNNKINKGVNLYGYNKTVKVTGFNNTVAGKLYEISNDATRKLQQVYTVSGTEPRTITWTDSNGKKFTFKVTSKDGSEQSYKIYSNSGSYYLYGDNINVSIVDDDTNSTSSYGSSDIYFYGTNSDISIDKVAYNTDVVIIGDNNNILANAGNSNTSVKIKGDNNIINSTDKITDDGMDVYVLGKNNKVGYRDISLGTSDYTTYTLPKSYTIEGTDSKTITYKTKDGKNIEFAISSPDGSKQIFYAILDGSYSYIYADGLNIDINDKSNLANNSYATQYIKFRGTNNTININETSKVNVNYEIIGNKNTLNANKNMAGSFDIYGDDNSLNAGTELNSAKTVNIRGYNNVLNGEKVVSTLTTSYNYLCSGAKFYYKNNIKITADNFVKVFDKDADGKVTKADLIAMKFTDYDINDTGTIDSTDAKFIRMMVMGLDSDGNKVGEQLFNLDDENFATPENLAQLQYNIENNIDVMNSKAAINAIIATGKIKIDYTPISSIDDLDKVYEIYAEAYNSAGTYTEMALDKDTTLASALEEFISLYTDYVRNNSEHFNFGYYSSAESYISEVEYGYRTFYGYGNSGRTATLHDIINHCEIPAEVRQAAENVLTLDAQNKEVTPQIQTLENADKLCNDENVKAYQKAKANLKLADMQTAIAELTAKGESRTAEENTKLEELNSNYALEEANYEAIYNNNFAKLLEFQGKINPLTTDQSKWNASSVTKTTYLEVKNTNEVSATTLTENIISQKLSSANFVKDETITAQKLVNTTINSLADFYGYKDITIGDLNNSNILYAFTLMNSTQKLNAVTVDTTADTITVHLPGEYNNKIFTPRTYELSELQQMTSVALTYDVTLEDGTKTTQTTLKSLSSGDIIFKAIEMATIDNFGAEAFDNEISIGNAYKYLTGLSTQTSSYANWNNAISFTKDNKTYLVAGYDKDSDTLYYADINDLNKTLTSKTNTLKGCTITTTNDDKSLFKISNEAAPYINNINEVTAKTIYADNIQLANDILYSHFSSYEEYSAFSKKHESEMTEAANDLNKMITEYFTSNNIVLNNQSSVVQYLLETEIGDIANKWAMKYQDSDISILTQYLAANYSLTSQNYSGVKDTGEVDYSDKLKELITLKTTDISEETNIKTVDGKTVDANKYLDEQIDEFKQGTTNDCWLLTYLDKMDNLEASDVLTWNDDGSATVYLYEVNNSGTIGKKCKYNIPAEYLVNDTSLVKYKSQTYSISTGDITVRAMEIAMILHDVDKTVVGSNTAIADRMFFGDISSVVYKNAGEYTENDIKFAYTCALSGSSGITITDISGNNINILANHTYTIQNYNATDKTVTIVNPHDTKNETYTISTDTLTQYFNIATNPYEEKDVTVKNSDGTTSTIKAKVYTNPTATGVSATILDTDETGNQVLTIYSNDSVIANSYEIVRINNVITINGYESTGKIYSSTTINQATGNILQQFDMSTGRQIDNYYSSAGILLRSEKLVNGNQVNKFSDTDIGLDKYIYGVGYTPGSSMSANIGASVGSAVGSGMTGGTPSSSSIAYGWGVGTGADAAAAWAAGKGVSGLAAGALGAGICAAGSAAWTLAHGGDMIDAGCDAAWALAASALLALGPGGWAAALAISMGVGIAQGIWGDDFKDWAHRMARKLWGDDVDGGGHNLCSPLSFDIDGNGIKTSTNIIDYDIDGDGITERINDSADFVLVFDKDKNGVAGEDGSELFGNNTDINNDGKADGYSNGFEALKALAVKYQLISEDDDVLDTTDLKYLENIVGLKMKNGYLGDTYTFSELGITEIRLPKTTLTALEENFDAKGNNLMTQYGATFIINGEEKQYADIWHKKY